MPLNFSSLCLPGIESDLHVAVMDLIRLDVILPSKHTKLGFSALIIDTMREASIESKMFMSATAATNWPSFECNAL